LNSNASKQLTIRDLMTVFRRRRSVILSATAILVILAGIYCLFSTRKYEAAGTIQVQSKSQDRLGLETITGNSTDGDGDSVSVNMEIQTQANILQSDTLALKTIEELHMMGTRDFAPHRSPMGWLTGFLKKPETAKSHEGSLEDSPQNMRSALATFSGNLKVKPVPGTRLIQIAYVSSDPKLAAATVDTLIKQLVNYTFKTRFEATNQAADWLSGQLGDLRSQSEQLQRRVAELESKSGIYSLGTPDPRGRDQAYSGILDQLQQVTTALSQAEQNRILRGAILHAVDSGDAEMLSGLAGNSMNGAAVNNTLALIQTLRSQEASQQAALKQAESKYGEAYPKLDEFRSSIAGIHHSIQQEIERLKQRAQSDYDSAAQDEAETRAKYDKVKAQADTLNNKSVDFAILRQEADESRKLYQQLLERFKEAGVLESLKGSTITVVDPGRIPGAPKTPNVRMTIAAGMVGGFFLGCSLALLLEALDNRIHTVDDVERISGNDLAGATPLFTTEPAKSGYDVPSRLATLRYPHSAFVEAVRGIRTEVLLRCADASSSVVLVTSSISGEGKTTLCANLAVLLAQANKKVLLVDADLRLGTLYKILTLSRGAGLSELLDGLVPRPEICSVSEVSNLDVLQSGLPATFPSELLGSSIFSHWLSVWRVEYDFIVLDSAPLMPVTDSLTLASLSDLILLVARPGLTEKAQLIRSHQLLKHCRTHTVASVVNGLPPEAEGYSTYFGYSRNKSQYSEMTH
jgi:capsular exopolysaccharide synthesis family protein